MQIHDREKRWKKLTWGGGVKSYSRSGEGRGKYEKLLCKLDFIFRVAVRVMAERRLLYMHMWSTDNDIIFSRQTLLGYMVE